MRRQVLPPPDVLLGLLRELLELGSCLILVITPLSLEFEMAKCETHHSLARKGTPPANSIGEVTGTATHQVW
jgi:hypothetical protein